MLDNPLRAVFKAARITRDHGARALIVRAVEKTRRNIEAQAAERLRRRNWRRSLALARRIVPLETLPPEHPLITVVVVTDAHLAWTSACLRALTTNADPSAPFEIIVANAPDTKDMNWFLAACSGIRILPDQGAGFAASVNAAAQLARGRYLHILTNDSVVTAGWARALVSAFERDATIGAVGSQLRGRDGMISEAGITACGDGRIAPYGAGRSPEDHGVAFLRSVDACSSASLMIRLDTFRRAGGFDETLLTRPHATLDFARRLRRLGRGIVYQPASVVARLSVDTKKLRKRPPDDAATEQAARRFQGSSIILVMDQLVPSENRDAGSRRLTALMRLMRELDAHVVFIPHEGGRQEEASAALRAWGIEVRTHDGEAFDALTSLPIAVDAAWIARPHICERYLPYISSYLHVPVIYDTVDLHHLRLRREEETTGKITGWQAMRTLEFRLMSEARRTVVTSTEEQRLLEAAGYAADLIPIIETQASKIAPSAGRDGMLFVGNFTHAPNVDALRVLAHEVMPAVRKRIPNAVLTVAGFDPNHAAEAFASESIRTLGHVPDLEPLFSSSRVFAAPLRYGSGAKGKIVQSLANGLPVVTTPVGAEGLGIAGERDCLIASETEAVADAVARAWLDDKLWNTLSQAGRASAARFTPSAVRPLLAEVLRGARELRG